jgi:hypothetical protein
MFRVSYLLFFFVEIVVDLLLLLLYVPMFKSLHLNPTFIEYDIFQMNVPVELLPQKLPFCPFMLFRYPAPYQFP